MIRMPKTSLTAPAAAGSLGFLMFMVCLRVPLPGGLTHVTSAGGNPLGRFGEPTPGVDERRSEGRPA